MKISRRKLLIAGSLAGLAGYSVSRGLRYPTLSWSPTPLAQAQSFKDCRVLLGNAIFSNYRYLDEGMALEENNSIYIRAYDVEPEIELMPYSGSDHHIVVNNISPHAILAVDTEDTNSLKIDEQTNGISRVLTLSGASGESIHLKWELPKDRHHYKVACIGDSGGNQELDWCIERAKRLGADFFLHLGDFVYNPGEYDMAIEKFYNSSIPCYISIGNHDFHHNGLIYPKFREQLSPLNHSVNLFGTQFINLDTAADFFPVDGGLRGGFVDTLLQDQRQFDERIVFTHRPLKDAREGHDHVVGSIGEVDWLKQLCSNLGVETYLNGHVHLTAENDVDGLRQLTVGEGLAFNDILAKRPVGKILMIDVKQGEKPDLNFKALNMQDDYRCSSYIGRAMLGREYHIKDLEKLTKNQLDLCPTDL